MPANFRLWTLERRRRSRPRSRGITGQTLMVNGGELMR
jgi:hypothetical protein